MANKPRGTHIDKAVAWAEGLAPNVVVGRTELAKVVGVTDHHAGTVINSLTKKGHLVRVGFGRYTRPAPGVVPVETEIQKAKQLEMPLGAGVLQVTLQCLKIIRKLPPTEQAMALAFLREAL